MTPYSAAQEHMRHQPLNWRLRKVPLPVRDLIVEGFVLNRGRLRGVALEERIFQHVHESNRLAVEGGHANAIPTWLIALALEWAIRAMMKILERWWDRRPAVENTGGA